MRTTTETFKVGDICKVIDNVGDKSDQHTVRIGSIVVIRKIGSVYTHPYRCNLIHGKVLKDYELYEDSEFGLVEEFGEEELELCDSADPKIIAKIVAYQLKQS